MTPRVAITAIFTINGFAVGTWGGRIPAIQDHLDAGPGSLAIPLAAIAVGALVSMPLGGRAATHFGSRRAVTIAILAVGVCLPLPALAPGLALVTIATLALGAANGALDVVMNTQGVSVERVLRRPVLSSLHAGFSFGGLAGAGTAALAAATDVAVLPHFAMAGAFVVVSAGWCAMHLIADVPDPRPAAVAPDRSHRWRLRGIAFCCLMSEGAALDWSAVHLRDIGTASAVAALAYGGFSLAMACGRLTGDRLMLHWGPVQLARRGGAVGATALALALALDEPIPALLSYTALGAGLSVIIPLVFRAAATGSDAGPGLAGITTVGYLGFLAGPPAIGVLASATSVPTALWLVVAATGIVALSASALAPTGEISPA